MWQFWTQIHTGFPASALTLDGNLLIIQLPNDHMVQIGYLTAG